MRPWDPWPFVMLAFAASILAVVVRHVFRPGAVADRRERVAFALTAAFVLLLYFTRRAVLEGRAWGRVASIVLGVLLLLNFPFGTVLGIFMLIGAFDRDVQRYVSR